MKFKTWECLLIVIIIVAAIGATGNTKAARFARSASYRDVPRAIEFMSAEDLKARLAKGEGVTIIDVRSSSDTANSETKIKGAIHVKLRRLKYRLTLPPLSNVARDSEVVLYCACPNDEASVRGVELLLESGFKRVYVLKGGWVAWKRSGGQVETRQRG